MAVQRKKKNKESNGPSAPAWMVTYSDMVTLLLTFFVLMLSMAEMDKVKFQRAVVSLQGAFGIMENKPPEETQTDVIVPEIEPIPLEMLQSVYRKMLLDLQKLELDEDIELVKDRGAIVLRIKEKVLFDLGSTRLKKEAEPVLGKVARLVKPLPFQVRIEGHADSQPFGARDQTNWDLSAQRAIGVVKFIAQNELLSLDRLSAVGYGDQKPLVPNDTPENRALNRRVEFILETGGDYRQELPFLVDSSDQLPF
ncbi:chemotaxis protein MotB [Desulfosalsimonas propionicica]|uniref:Chemotaxis protein MotB n=1 Tax=Desulfosalsimonas propionicica TaxID=332175 RepID=A0A7W0C8X9_9BACT|nr:flagellar motor protein MotB [Desulfosalsimonas propionicica]MBA2881307.1 chemotaxis protein MotB [Desulfosalsimonas propionicica]